MKTQKKKTKKEREELKKLRSKAIKTIAILVICFLILFIVDTSYSSKENLSMFELVSGCDVICAIVVLVVIIVIALVLLVSWIFDLLGANLSDEAVIYNVNIWQPAVGGENCLECNDLRYGCSEYQCRASGKSCVWVNDEQESGICVWNNSGDGKPPIIKPDESVLKIDYVYDKNNAIAPPDKGVYLKYQKATDKCVPAFTNVTLGIYTDEPAVCKADMIRQHNYDSMRFSTDQGNVPYYNHSIFIPSSAFPSASAFSSLGILLEQGSEENYFYFRCEDVNGNSNIANFLITFCIDKGPDLTAPIITGTSFPTNPAYVAFGNTQMPIEIYTNEPADCKWDFQDLHYDKMAYDFSNCSQEMDQYLRGVDYGCQANLTGIQNEESTVYYFRCKDQPWLEQEDPFARKVNKQSYIFTLLGAPPLIIDEVLMNDKSNPAVLKDNTDTVQIVFSVKTSAGAEEGKAECFYDYRKDQNYIRFSNTDATISTQPLWYEAGEGSPISYELPIKCADSAGNQANITAEFSVEKDTTPPEVARAYYEEGKLKLITNEPAECVYSNADYCNYVFENASIMNSGQDNSHHFVEWETQMNYYVKCKDIYENKPAPNQCSIIVKGSDHFV